MQNNYAIFPYPHTLITPLLTASFSQLLFYSCSIRTNDRVSLSLQKCTCLLVLEFSRNSQRIGFIFSEDELTRSASIYVTESKIIICAYYHIILIPSRNYYEFFSSLIRRILNSC